MASLMFQRGVPHTEVRECLDEDRSRYSEGCRILMRLRKSICGGEYDKY